MCDDLVTVIVPIYNAEKYLEKCILSILNQSYINLEIVLINDGSSDGSMQICNKYSYDKRIKIIDKTNEGLSIARQVGIDSANGEYFCTVDSDDWIESDYIKEMHSTLSSYRGDVCICAWKTHQNGDIIYNEMLSHVQTPKRYSIDEIELTFNECIDKLYLSDSWNKMYRKQFVIDSGVKFTLSKEYVGTDMLFNILLFLHQPIIVSTDKYLLNYNVIQNSKTKKKDKPLFKGFCEILISIINKSEKLGYSIKLKKQLKVLLFNFTYMSVVDIVNESANYSNAKDRLIYLKHQYTEFCSSWLNDQGLKLKKANHNLFAFLFKKNQFYLIYILFNIRNLKIEKLK